ncbi:phage baseplate protein [Metarhizobium album]|uniref:Phage baseplate protein n=1 Tax=Metarhizobium album TaxID=2182425 RepID=A0A2U2DFQ4_9HYPH|nr:phage baseplate assembly protein V [Rhizobium album]PWE52155.1 phage baseplate protein [Rhizobium album]
MRSYTATEIRRVREQLDQVNRRLALMSLPGKAGHFEPDKRLLRLTLGKTKDGKDILGPKVRWQEATAGGMKIHSQPAENEQMILASQSGTVGQASIAMPATYDQDHAAPSQSTDTAVFDRGGRIELSAGGIRIIGRVTIEGDGVTHNGKNIGDTHEHTGVIPGAANTGPPAG